MRAPFFFSEMLNTFEETFEVTEMRTFKHEPFFFIVGGRGGGGGGGGAYSWYFMVIRLLFSGVGIQFAKVTPHTERGTVVVILFNLVLKA